MFKNILNLRVYVHVHGNIMISNSQYNTTIGQPANANIKSTLDINKPHLPKHSVHFAHTLKINYFTNEPVR